jgi:hypothetical protein
LGELSEKVIFLDILEIFVGAVLQFVGGIFVADDDGMGMLLQAGAWLVEIEKLPPPKR